MKTRFLLGVLLLFSITMQGQQVKVNYENITNSLPIILQEYFRMQGVQEVYLQPIITQYFIDNKSEIWLLFLIAHSKR